MRSVPEYDSTGEKSEKLRSFSRYLTWNLGLVVMTIGNELVSCCTGMGSPCHDICVKDPSGPAEPQCLDDV